MAAQRLEERLKAAVDGAAQDESLDLDVAHPERALDLARRGDADESHLDSLHLRLFGHAGQPRKPAGAANP